MTSKYSSLFPIVKRRWYSDKPAPYRSHTMVFEQRKKGYCIYVSDWIMRIAIAPERAWRYVLCRLWLDRLTYQYERGYAAGLREGLTQGHNYADLTPQELEAIIATPAYQGEKQ